MSIQTTLTFNDGKATPVAHNFAPKGARSSDGKDIAIWRDQSVANAIGYLTLTEQHTGKNANGMEKFRWTLDVPVLEQASSGGTYVPPPTRAYGNGFAIEVWTHERALQAELDDIAAYVKNFTALAYLATAIKQREAAW